MLLDIRRIFAAAQPSFTRERTLSLAGMDFPGYEAPQPFEAHVEGQLHGGVLAITLSFDARVQFLCARCMEPAEKTFRVLRTYEVRESDCMAEEPELPFDENGRLDVRELCYQELVMEVPTVLLCSDDCAGLCPICGRRKPCACTQETNGDVVDERLAILKTLL